MANQIRSHLLLGTYESDRKKSTTWNEFRSRYETTVLCRRAWNTKVESKASLNNLERILNLNGKIVSCLNTERIDEFIAKRRTEPGKKPKSILSPASVNKDLRMIKAALNQAVEWGYLDIPPKFKMEREPKKLVSYMTAEHFTAIYNACDSAKMPTKVAVSATDWWRGLLAMGYMTGWRISEMLALKWADLDLETGIAITRAEDNKGGRDEAVKLHDFVLEHLTKLRTFDDHVFPWNHHRRTLDVEFTRIQDAAGINIRCGNPRKHDCTPAFHRYGFHDERRSFATRCRQAGIEAEVLQRLMRHTDYSTTLRYINMADAENPSVVALDAPQVKNA